MFPPWTFISNHGHVLLALAKDPDLRVREIAGAVGITERAVQSILGELVEQGYVLKSKDGRRNAYRIREDAFLRHPLEAGVTLGDFMGLVRRSPR